MRYAVTDRPPQVVAIAYRPFLLISASEEYVCGACASHAAEFPTVYRPLWRGEFAKGIECARCGIDLDEL
jgi:hypothetical protein